MPNPTDPAAVPACHYCQRATEPLGPCCGHHPETLVCADAAGCRDYLLAVLRAAGDDW